MPEWGISNLPPDHTISPLTFLQTYQAANASLASLPEWDAVARYCPGSSGAVHALTRTVATPLYYHWGTSGYGAFIGETPVGWLYLCGWRQILFIRALVVHPEWRRRGIGSDLLRFAEQQACGLHREWLGLLVPPDNTPALCLCEKQGYRRGHWRVMRRESKAAAPPQPEEVRLQPLLALAAERAYHHFARLDLSAGEAPDVAVQSRLLGSNLYRRPGQHWLITCEGQSIGYLNRHGPESHPVLYLACGPEWWGTPQTLRAVMGVLDRREEAPPGAEVRLGSSGHHDAARSMLEQLGFAERPAAMTGLFKHLSGSTPVRERHIPEGEADHAT